MLIPIRIKRAHPDAIIHGYANPGDMCFDLAACLPHAPAVLMPGEVHLVPTGLAFELPDGWGLNVYSRSSSPLKLGVTLANGVGKIDNGYRGELKLLVHNLRRYQVTLDHGDRIAQAELVPIYRADFEVVEVLGETLRGAGGFGSTGQGSE